MQRQIQMVMFMKNTALAGSALLVYVLGSGPVSLDSRVQQPRSAKAA